MSQTDCDCGGVTRRMALALGAGGLLALVSGCTSTPVVPPERVANVVDFGADWHGRTDSTVAFSRAAQSIGGSGFVVVPRGKYQIRRLRLPRGVGLLGVDMPVLSCNGPTAAFIEIDSPSSSRVSNLQIDSGNFAAVAIVRIAGNTAKFTLENCTLKGLAYAGIDILGNSRDISIRDCILRGAGSRNALRVLGGTRLQFIGNEISQWQGRAIYVQGSASFDIRDVLIDSNTIHDLNQNSARPRHPIQLVGNAAKNITGVQIRKNSVTGPGRSWTHPAAPGTADQISMVRVTDFSVCGNSVRAGGDVGITISTGCEHGIVAHNMVSDNDTNGIFVSAHDVTIEGNNVLNNGQDRQADRGPNRAGIAVRGSTTVTLKDNVSGDNQDPPTQSSGIQVLSSTNVKSYGNIGGDDPTAFGS